MRPPRQLLAMMMTVMAMFIAPASASAHSHLVSSTPAADAVLKAPPKVVVLEFSGRVVAGAGAVQVFGPDGTEVQTGNPRPAEGTRISQAVTSSTPGTYGVSYRVSSEDGHVINGSLTYAVGAASSGHAAEDASSDAASVDRSLQVAFSTARFVEVLSLLLVAGGGIFACLLAPGWRARLLVPGLVLLLVAYAAGFVLTSAILRGEGIVDALGVDAWRATADTPFGRSIRLRAGVAIVAFGPALLLRSRLTLPVGARRAMAIVFVGLAASLSITGHAVTTEPTWLRMPLDMVHVVAAAIWLGGLLQLAFLAPFAATWIDSIRRFSRVAFASVVVILLTGVYATFAELGTSLGDLLESTYGRLILAKLALYLGTMPLAWNNMSAFVPKIMHRPDDAPRMLRQYVWRELALVVVVLVLTVWLIATPQP